MTSTLINCYDSLNELYFECNQLKKNMFTYLSKYLNDNKGLLKADLRDDTEIFNLVFQSDEKPEETIVVEKAEEPERVQGQLTMSCINGTNQFVKKRPNELVMSMSMSPRSKSNQNLNNQTVQTEANNYPENSEIIDILNCNNLKVIERIYNEYYNQEETPIVTDLNTIISSRLFSVQMSEKYREVFEKFIWS